MARRPWLVQDGVAAPALLRFQVDVESLQISFQSKSGGPRFLLVAEHSNVTGCELGPQVALSPSLTCAPPSLLPMKAHLLAVVYSLHFFLGRR